jgi:hypothetical protein
MVKSETCLYTPPEHVKGVLFLRFCMKHENSFLIPAKTRKKNTHFFHFYLVTEYLLTWVLLAGFAVPFFSNYKCISVWAQVLTLPKIFKTRSYFEILKHFSAEYCGGNDLSWTTWRQPFISRSSAGWMTPTFFQLICCKFQQGICSFIQKEREKILPISANGIPTNLIFKFSRFQWPYYCDQQRGWSQIQSHMWLC